MVAIVLACLALVFTGCVTNRIELPSQPNQVCVTMVDTEGKPNLLTTVCRDSR
jgi:hypothetical protein